METVSNNRPNRLIHEKSPYLLQHAHNPVDWYTWGEEAFEKARRENKPVFLSIGYSTCHWCHVMARESFQDQEVARLMNEVFVSIKVDREERPDLDTMYMTACHMLAGGGGWPLTIIMTPEKKPFLAATYVPRESRFGRIGMLELISQIKDAWARRPEESFKVADQGTAAMRRATQGMAGSGLDKSVLKLAYEQLSERFDEVRGGFGEAPKFPTTHNLFFLLRWWRRTGDRKALDMAERTLQAMRLGGIYDQVGFGFHRYSTDSKWFLPHFEKMLYDQATLSMAYLEAYQATRKREYEQTAREVLDYVLRDMQAPEGGFYSAEDAESEGEEGRFYVWTVEEIRGVLGREASELVTTVYNLEAAGNFTDEATGTRAGRNILFMEKTPAEIAAGLGMTEPDLRTHLEAARRELFVARRRRVRPHKDDKVLTDWNGLMIAALAKGAQALDEPRFAEEAGRAARFILANLTRPDGRLLHRYRDGESAFQANVDDYAFLIWGLLELYEASLDVYYLHTALDLNRTFVEHFWDGTKGGFYFAPDDGDHLLVRQKEVYDGAVPSGNSVAMLNLLRLGRITGDSGLEEKAAAIGQAFSALVRQFPSGYTQLMVALDFAVGPSSEVVIAGNLQSEDTRRMLKVLRESYSPNKVVIFRPDAEDSPAIADIAPFTQGQTSIDGRATAYVCRNQSCTLPTTEAGRMLELLGGEPGRVGGNAVEPTKIAMSHNVTPGEPRIGVRGRRRGPETS